MIFHLPPRYAGSLEEEIRKYYEHLNREVLFQLARIDDEINYLGKRIELSEKEKSKSNSKKYLTDFVKEMKSQLEELQNQKAELTSQRKVLELTVDDIAFLNNKLKYFISNIKSETPEQQHNLLKELLVLVTANKLSGGFKLIYRLEIPSKLNSDKEIVLEKTIYFNSDSQL